MCAWKSASSSGSSGVGVGSSTGLLHVPWAGAGDTALALLRLLQL
jgi:hypothetical protein